MIKFLFLAMWGTIQKKTFEVFSPEATTRGILQWSAAPKTQPNIWFTLPLDRPAALP